MIVENCGYLRDPRVRKQAKALKESGYQVTVISPGADKLLWGQLINGVLVYQFPAIQFFHGPFGYFLEYAYATCVIAAMTLYVLVIHGFDVVHVANPPDCLVLVAAIYKLIGKRIIFDQHDLSPVYISKFRRPNRPLLGLFETQFAWQHSIPDLLAVYGVVDSEAIVQPLRHRLIPKVQRLSEKRRHE